MNFEQWNGFDCGEWQESINVRDFIDKNYTSYTGDSSFLKGPTKRTEKALAELFAKLKVAGIHTALDTSGCVYNAEAEKLLSVTDLVLLDHKYSSEAAYRENTLCSMKTVEDFLAKLNKRDIQTWLRRVIIPRKNDDAASVLYLNETAKRYDCVQKTELLPFRNLCAEKYTAMGIPFPLADTPSPSNETMRALSALLDK